MQRLGGGTVTNVAPLLPTLATELFIRREHSLCLQGCMTFPQALPVCTGFVFSMKCVFTHSLCMWLCLCENTAVSGCDIMCYLSPVIPHFPDFLPTPLTNWSFLLWHPLSHPIPNKFHSPGFHLGPSAWKELKAWGWLYLSVLMMPRLQLWLKFRTGFLIPENTTSLTWMSQKHLKFSIFHIQLTVASSPTNHTRE